METRIKCRCGKRLSVKPEWAGRRAKCPQCGISLLIPRAEREQSLPESAERRKTGIEPTQDVSAEEELESCASCKADKPASKIVCPHCSYSKRLRRRLKKSSSFSSAPSSRKPAKPTSAPAKAKSTPAKKNESNVLLNVVAVLGIFAMVGLVPVVIIFLIQSGLIEVVHLLGKSLVLLAFPFMGLIAYVWVTVIAFRNDDLVWAVVCLVVPCAFWIYGFTHWDTCWKPMLLAIFAHMTWMLLYFAASMQHLALAY
jgi:hypothetical protein